MRARESGAKSPAAHLHLSVRKISDRTPICKIVHLQTSDSIHFCATSINTSIFELRTPSSYDPSLTRHTSRSMLASFRLSMSMAFCARSSRVAPSTIFCFCGATIPSLSIVYIMSGCKWYLKNSFCELSASFSTFLDKSHVHQGKNVSGRPARRRLLANMQPP